MFRRLCVRLFLCCVAFVGLLVVSVCLAGFLATREPGFYVELKSEEFTSTEQKLAEVNMRLLEKQFEGWTARSLSLQRQSAQPGQVGVLAALQGEYDPAKDTHVVRIAERQLNAMLSSTEAQTRGDWQKPRVRIVDDRIDVACEIVSKELSCVVSASVRPTMTEDGKLQLDLISAQVGKLPLPLSTLWSWLREMDIKEGEVEIDRTSTRPRLHWKLAQRDAESPSVNTIECRAGELAIEFRAPVLKQAKLQGGNVPLASLDAK